MSKNYEEQINDVQRKIKKLEAHLEYLEKLKELRDNGPSVTREKESHEVEK
jgi:CHASE3 domain sensor protein